jgi:hypothetical protein
MPVWVFLGSSVCELCGAQILGFAFKTYMAYNNLPSTTVQACDEFGTIHYVRGINKCAKYHHATPKGSAPTHT